MIRSKLFIISYKNSKKVFYLTDYMKPVMALTDIVASTNKVLKEYLPIDMKISLRSDSLGNEEIGATGSFGSNGKIDLTDSLISVKSAIVIGKTLTIEDPKELFSGVCSQFGLIGERRFQAKYTSIISELNLSVCPTYFSESCRAVFGGMECKIDISKYSKTCIVKEITDTGSLIVELENEAELNDAKRFDFENGWLEWIGQDMQENYGISRLAESEKEGIFNDFLKKLGIKLRIIDFNEAKNCLELHLNTILINEALMDILNSRGLCHGLESYNLGVNMFNLMQCCVGKSIRIIPNCNKTIGMCSKVFNNVKNFRGEPFIKYVNGNLTIQK